MADLMPSGGIVDLRLGLALNLQGAGAPRDGDRLTFQLGLIGSAVDGGIDSVFALEHHFTDYVVSPSPLQLLAFISGRWPGLHLGTAVLVLPWHDTTRLAEDIAQLDNLNGGNCTFGVGRGRSIMEHAAFGQEPAAVKEVFETRLRELRDSLMQGTIKRNGSSFELRPRPIFAPHSRIAFAASDWRSAVEIAGAGGNALVNWDRSVTEELGATASAVANSSALTIVASTFVARSKDRALTRTARALVADTNLRRQHYGDSAAEAVIEDGIFGTPDEVLEKVCALRHVAPESRLVLEFAFGDLADHEVVESLRLFVDAVVPRVGKDRDGAEAIS